jgi:DNA-binding transcriptional regulator PaaX
MSKISPNNEARSPLLDVKGACAYLGGIHRATLDRLVASGRLVRRKIAGRSFYMKSDLDRFIRSSGKRTAVSESRSQVPHRDAQRILGSDSHQRRHRSMEG